MFHLRDADRAIFQRAHADPIIAHSQPEVFRALQLLYVAVTCVAKARESEQDIYGLLAVDAA
jgi:hypothetical protein